MSIESGPDVFSQYFTNSVSNSFCVVGMLFSGRHYFLLYRVCMFGVFLAALMNCVIVKQFCWSESVNFAFSSSVFSSSVSKRDLCGMFSVKLRIVKGRRVKMFNCVCRFSVDYFVEFFCPFFVVKMFRKSGALSETPR